MSQNIVNKSRKSVRGRPGKKVASTVKKSIKKILKSKVESEDEPESEEEEEEEDEEQEAASESDDEVVPSSKKTILKRSPKKNVFIPSSTKSIDTSKYTKMYKCLTGIESNSSMYFTDSKMKLEEMYKMSPKLKVLIENIKNLDKNDMNENNRLYKHYIYSSMDKRGNRGMKLIKRALEAEEIELKYFTVRKENSKSTSKQIVDEFNNKDKKHPNPDGINIRFLGLTKQYKEGIDLEDVKYVHIFEEPATESDRQQIIGRGTRFCGQKNLPFPRELKVFIYTLSIPISMRKTYRNSRGEILNLNKNYLSDVYMEYRDDYDKYVQYITKYAHYMSVDFPLTQDYIPLEKIPLKNGYKEVDKVIINEWEYDTLKKLKFQPYDRDDKKKQQINDLLNSISYKLKKKKKVLDDDSDEEDLVNSILNLADDKNFEVSSDEEEEEEEEREEEEEEEEEEEDEEGEEEEEDLVNSILENKLDGQDPKVFIYDKNLHDNFHKIILKLYGDLKWNRAEKVDKCIMNQKEPFIAGLNPTQKFLIHYFKPESALKGMLVWHSVGSGKTCTCISLASGYYEADNWRIILVTRKSLKQSFYKNIFGTICHQKMGNSLSKIELAVEKDRKIDSTKYNRDGLKENTFTVIPPTSSLIKEKYMANQINILNRDLWTEPITYKVFSNLCGNVNKKMYGTNEISKHIKKDSRHKDNKEEKAKANYDPFYKTLIIIDEAHYLFKDDPEDAEGQKPNIEEIKKALYSSQEKSGKNSAKVLLMSATPMNADPKEFIDLINLLKTKENQIKMSKDQLIKMLDKDMEGNSYDFLNFISENITGYISYLNRLKDPGYFAQTDDAVYMEADMSKKQENAILSHELFKSYKVIENLKPIPTRKKMASDDMMDMFEKLQENLDDDDFIELLNILKKALSGSINYTEYKYQATKLLKDFKKELEILLSLVKDSSSDGRRYQRSLKKKKK